LSVSSVLSVAKKQKTFAGQVLAWFERHGRKDLPWQQDPTPYRVWVSEIMLQQTQVRTVIPYYQRFMQAFPDLRALAAAPLDQVLHHWSGLGYYARARNLHRAAQRIRDDHAGRFPEDIEVVMRLPGIGRSTAGAVLSLACGQRHAILDGNVKRVLARFHAVEGWPGKTAVLEQLWALAEAATPQRDVAAYNQAMMDLGATLCRRGTPECPRCPLQSDCRACQRGRQSEFPAPRPRRDLPTRNVHMLLLSGSDGAVYLERRPASGIWGGLWSFPEFDTEAALLDWCDQRNIPLPERLETWQALRHTFSHFHLDITPCRLRLKNRGFSVMEGGGAVWYNTGQSEALGLAAPVQRLLAQLQNSI
jgi:A/G-specific adenine glycosylase